MVCDLTTGLIVSYHYTGGSMLDSSGNGNTATNNGTTNTADKNSVINNARDHSGVNTNLDISIIPDVTGTFTVNIWCNPTSFSSPQANQYLFDANGTKRLIITLNHSAVSNNIGFWDGGAWRNFGVTSTSGVWKMYTFTFNSGTAELFIDGVSQGTIAYTTGTTDITGTVLIGAESSAGTAREYNGKQDEFRIYSVIIDQNTIDALFTGYDAPTCAVAANNNALSYGAGL